MKKTRLIALIIMTVIIVSIFTACGSKKADNTAVSAYKELSVKYGAQDSGSTGSTEEALVNGLAGNGEMVLSSTVSLSGEKIITKVNLEVETQDFDNLIAAVKKDIERLGGYEEKSEISGRRYYSRSLSRYAYIVARIPKDRLKDFVTAVKENGNVINESSSSENVTLQYVDTESRKKALEIEQERLFAILEKTESLEDIVTLESRLSSIRHELQMYETELRTIDNQVEYSTVTLSINEVERITPTEDKQTVISRIKNGLSETIYDITEGFKNFVVWFVVNLPYILIWAVIFAAAFIVYKKLRVKIRRKKGIIKIRKEKVQTEEVIDSDKQ